MKITIEGEPKEIAALVLAVQERPEVKKDESIINAIAEGLAAIVNSTLATSGL